ncbi:MAG: TonB-dependent receptor [Pseudomonadota bacterium]|nr:TonB-dependent receptor [Pseudomonadota bacterium]
MKKQLITTSLAGLAAGLVWQAGASAQSLDYTAMSELFGEPVTAGATGAPQRASDVPATMVIITGDDIRRFPERDIPGILRHYAGMDVTRYGIGDGQVNIRGAATGYVPRLLVLVNGREVYLDSYGYTAWSTLPVQLDEIQQIEVVKGAQSALYGFNAVSGVVNIITRNPELGDYAIGRVDGGTDGYTDLSLVAAYGFGERASVRFSLGSTRADEFDGFPGNTDAAGFGDLEFSRDTLAVEGRFALTEKVNLLTEVTHSEVHQAESTSIALPAESEYEITSYRVGVEADTDLGFLTVTGFRNEVDVLYSFGLNTTSLTAFAVEDLFKVGTRNTVRLSVEYRDGESNSFPAPGNGDFGYETLAASAMWNRKFSDSMELTLAGRYDSVDWSRDGDPDPALYPFSQSDYDVSIEEFSYNAALVWRPEFGGAMRFSTGRGVLAPTMFDIGFALPVTVGGNSLVIAGNPDIEPAIVTNYEIAYDRALTPTLGLRAAVFRHETESDRGAFGPVPDLFPPAANVPVFLFDNRGDTATSGAELTLNGDPEGPWNWSANYTLQSVDDDLSPFGVNTVRDYEGATPSHLANARVGWTGERFRADVLVNYVSSMDMPMQPAFGAVTRVAIDDVVSASFRGEYIINEHLSVALNAQNANFGDGEETNPNTLTESRFWLSLRAGF